MPVWDVSVAERKFHHLVIEGSKRMFSLDLTWKETGSLKTGKEKDFCPNLHLSGWTDV